MTEVGGSSALEVEKRGVKWNELNEMNLCKTSRGWKFLENEEMDLKIPLSKVSYLFYINVYILFYCFISGPTPSCILDFLIK